MAGNLDIAQPRYLILGAALRADEKHVEIGDVLRLAALAWPSQEDPPEERESRERDREEQQDRDRPGEPAGHPERLAEAFDDGRVGHAAALAHRLQAVAAAAAFE